MAGFRYGSESVKGLAAARKAFKDIDPVMREHLNEATEQTTLVTLFDAKRRLTPGHGVRTGILRDQLASSFSAKTGFGRVGIKKGTFVININGRSLYHKPSKIGHLVEFGHGGPHPAQAYPFMVPAAEGQRSLYVQRLTAAGKKAERKLEYVGGRNL